MKKNKKTLQLYKSDGIETTKEFQEAHKSLEEPIKLIWKTLESKGWKPYQIKHIVDKVCDFRHIWHQIGLEG